MARRDLIGVVDFAHLAVTERKHASPPTESRFGLTGKPPGSTRRDYELSFPPASQSVSTSGQRRRVLPPPRPVVSRKQDGPEQSEEDARPVFKGRRGR